MPEIIFVGKLFIERPLGIQKGTNDKISWIMATYCQGRTLPDLMIVLNQQPLVMVVVTFNLLFYN
jgi:hypothetical protein